MLVDGLVVDVKYQRVPGQKANEIRYLILGNGLPLGMVWRHEGMYGRPWWHFSTEPVRPALVNEIRSVWYRRGDAARRLIRNLFSEQPQVKQTVAQAVAL